jgi:hypothetical protein
MDTIYKLFDAALKVNSPWALAAFGIAAVVAILWLWLSSSGGNSHVERDLLTNKSEERQERFAYNYYRPESFPTQVPRPVPTRAAASRASRPVIPWLAWVVLIVAIAVPVVAYAFVAVHSDLPYKFKVVAVDRDRGLIASPHVVCAAPGCAEEGLVDSAMQFALAPEYVPADKSVTFFADSNNSHGEKTVTLDKTRSVPVRVDIVPVAAPVASNPGPPPNSGKASQPGKRPATPGTISNPAAGGKAVDKFWLGDYATNWLKADSAETTDSPQGQSVVRSWSGEERYSVSIEATNRIVMTFQRRLTTPPSPTLCNAVWTGMVIRGNPGTIDFQVSREDQGDYFCDIPMTMALNGTIQRSGEQSFVVKSSFDPWHKVEVEMRGAKQ